MKKLKVSFVIPAYNVEKYIQRCLKSALNQTMDEIEVIVVNDGSTDNTLQIIEDIAKSNNKIKVINKINEGVSVARNEGINAAKGEYIQFIDGDDWIESTACEKMYNFSQEHKLDIVIANSYRDDDNGHLIIWKDLDDEQTFFTREEYLTALFERKGKKTVWNKLFSRTLFDNNTFPKGITMGQDFVATVKLVSKAKNIGKYNEAFVHYIVNPSSTTQNQVSKKMYQTFRVYENIEKYFKENSLYQEFQEAIEIHKQQAIFYFLKKKPYFGDENYEKGLEKTLEYFKSKPKIYKGLNFSRRQKLNLLKMFPTRKNLVRIIKFHN